VAIVNGYITEAQLREQLGDSGTFLTASLLQRAVNATSRAIDDFTGRRFWKDSAPVARTYRVRDLKVAWVDDIATTSGLIVQTDDGLDNTWSTTWTLGTDFDLEPENADTKGPAYAWWRIVAIGDKSFPVSRLRRTLKVTSAGGWSAIPDEIEQASTIKASSLFQRKDAPFGVAGFGEFGPVRITRRDPDVIELLNNFIRYDMKGV